MKSEPAVPGLDEDATAHDAAAHDAAAHDAAAHDAAAQDPAAEDAAVPDPAAEDAAVPDTGSQESGVGSDDESAGSAADSEPDADEPAGNAEHRERRRNRAVVRRSASGRESGGRSNLTTVAVACTALLVVIGVVLSAFFGIQNYQIQKDRQLRAEYASFAQHMVVSMFTLNPENADQMYKNVMDNTSGRAKQMFQENMKNTAKVIREGDMVTKTNVLADAVSKATNEEGSVLIVLDWEGHPKKDPKATQSESFRLRVDITRINGALKMTYLDWVA